MSYIVTAGYVTVETAVPGGRARIDLSCGTALPGDVPREDVDRLLTLGHIELVEPTSKPGADPRRRAKPRS